MAGSAFYMSFVVAVGLLCLLQETQGLHSPTGVRVNTINETDYLIVIWDYQRNAPYHTVAIRTFSISDNHNITDTTTVGPFAPAHCLPDNTTCSFCAANTEGDCQIVSQEYSLHIVTTLYHEERVDVQVGVCSKNTSDSCLEGSWVTFTTPAGAPSGVRDVYARPLTSNLLYVFWTVPSEPRGTIRFYTVYFKTPNGEEQNKRISDGTNGFLSNLSANTTYNIWVTASTSAKEGQRSNMTSVKTYESECSSSPCHNNATCELAAEGFTCECSGAWKGGLCDKPEGYTIDKGMCLDGNPRIAAFTSYNNVHLSFCVEKCNGQSRCKSFIYGTVEEDGSFPTCFLQTATRQDYTLKKCGFDYYEKGGLHGGSTTALSPKTTNVFLVAALLTRYTMGL